MGQISPEPKHERGFTFRRITKAVARAKPPGSLNTCTYLTLCLHYFKVSRNVNVIFESEHLPKHCVQHFLIVALDSQNMSGK